MIQTSCSELLVDTGIEDPQKAYEIFMGLFQRFGWESSPPLTVDLLRALKGGELGDEVDILVFDAEGNRAFLEYGYNGYIHTGFRLDSHCNDFDRGCYPLFRKVIATGGELIACDGGHTGGYKEWEQEVCLKENENVDSD